MAKALFGFTATTADVRLVDEVRALRARVRELTAELDRSRAENAVLAAALHLADGEALSGQETLSLPEPAYS